MFDGVIEDKKLEYKKAREAYANLELPPDLTGGDFDDALDVPALDGTGGSATYSEYAGQRRARTGSTTAAAGGGVLPDVQGVEMHRSGDKRWLEVGAGPRVVWPRIVSFWQAQGVLLVEQDAALGTMRTDWLDNRAEIRQDMVTRVLRKVVDGLYATSTRDQYRVRIEQGSTSNKTEVYLTHRAMEERLATDSVGEGTRTVWEPAPSDPEKEAIMLRRLMLYFGASQERAASQTSSSRGASSTPSGPRSRLVTEAGGATALLVPMEPRRAWGETGLALDRVGFAVEDRDRTRGVYYVRYDEAGAQEGKRKKGLGQRLKFWGGKDKSSLAQYQVKLEGRGDETRVIVLNEAGQRSNSVTGKRILSLLQEQL